MPATTPFKGEVKVVRTGYCTDCEFFLPEISNLFGDGQLVETNLRCEHEKICDRMYQIFKAGKVPAPLDSFDPNDPFCTMKR